MRAGILIVLLVVLGLGATQWAVAATPYDRAWAAYQGGDYATALKRARPLAESGNAQAQHLLGLMYGLGRGVPQDFVTGCMWENLAAFITHDEDTACSDIQDGMTAEQQRKWGFAPPGPNLGTLPDQEHTCPPATASCARIARYVALPADAKVTGPLRLVLSTEIVNAGDSARMVLVSSDGTLDPTGTGLAQVQLLVDGEPVGSMPAFDWRRTPEPASHSYRTVAAVELAPGRHTISLKVGLLNRKAGSSVTLLAGASISILSSTARAIQTASMPRDSGVFSTRSRAIPIVPLINVPKPVKGPAVLLLSASIFGDGGDAMLGIAGDKAACPWTAEQSWSVQDMASQAELGAPVFVPSILGANTPSTPTAIASVFPWPLQNMVDPVRYRVARGATLVAIERPHLLGAGYNEGFRNLPCATSLYRCFASSRGYDFCPKIGERSIVGRTRVRIGPDSDGVLMVMASTTPTADHNDKGGTVLFGLSIDGVDVGSVGRQELIGDGHESARRLVASYLADTDHPLAPGDHVIEAWINSTPGSDFKWASVPNDLTLLFFD
ncbi:MAG: hypothetical protein ACTHOR_19380 [Devosia sp.]